MRNIHLVLLLYSLLFDFILSRSLSFFNYCIGLVCVSGPLSSAQFSNFVSDGSRLRVAYQVFVSFPQNRSYLCIILKIL
ncbi:hypothetical protein WN944_001175 [Citrus x changshan-huyou]|uniref:Secreted protein n=1 Tax=Citrus x changshan-huyou TaxID=2935761 RepID=A0AAP0QCD7_9ROSI